MMRMRSCLISGVAGVAVVMASIPSKKVSNKKRFREEAKLGGYFNKFLRVDGDCVLLSG